MVSVMVLTHKPSFNTQPPEGGWVDWYCTKKPANSVSTHSRPKAAGRVRYRHTTFSQRFNTQPPEGGWAEGVKQIGERKCFNTQPPEGGW